MWFSSIFLKTLRDARIAVLGWGLGMGLLMFEIQAAVGSLMKSGSEKATLTSLASSFNWAGDPVALNTVGGYATWKNGIVIILMAIWPLIAASRIFRGSEERGSMDVLLSQPRGRLRMAGESILAVWAALLVMTFLTALVTFAGGRSAGALYTFADSMLFGLNLTLLCGVFASVALLVSQFVSERTTASGVTGGLLFLFIVMDMLHRVVPGTLWISRISPVYYYNLSKPLVVSFGTDFGAMGLLLLVSVTLTGIALAVFVRRDLGRTLAGPRWLAGRARKVVVDRSIPLSAWSLKSVYARGIAIIAVPTFWWTIGIAGFAGLMVVVVHQMESQLSTLASGSPFLHDLLTKVGGGHAALNELLLSSLFILLPMLSMAFAVTQATRWAADEEDGRHELPLSAPLPRLRMLLGRFAAVATAALFIGGVTLASTALAAGASGLILDIGHLAAAALTIVPQCLLMASIGYLFAGWLRTAIEAGLLSLLLVIWFFISFVGPELGWPKGVLALSALYYYGTPLVHGLPTGDMVAVLAVGAAALLAASVRYMRKDIGRT